MNSTIRVNKRYIIHDLLGKGGMGEVYKATDRLNRQIVALKQVTLPSEHFKDTPGSENDFHLALSDEFRTLASLRHPNIISVLDYGFEHKQPYFTMELLEGASTLLDAGRGLSLHQRIELLVQLLQALVYLHRRGVLHRDLKPGNILVTKSGVVKVLDFGLSLAGARSRSNVQDNTAGTLAYMAPELFSEETASVASDLYAVGVITCELLTDHHPFNQKNVALLINSILSNPPDLSSLDDDLEPIVARLLAKEPGERFASASEVIKVLCDAVDQPVPRESVAIRESFLQAAKFVGRREELQQLRSALDEIVKTQTAQTPRAWLLGGESGVGKSRLLDELRIRALVRGALVLRGQAITEGGVPYQVWRDPLRRLILSVDINDDDAGVLKSLIPDIESLLERPIPDGQMLDPQLRRNRFLTVVTGMFQSLQQPTLVLLEDLQWASDENLDLLKQIMLLTENSPLLIVANYRDDERPNLRDVLSEMQFLKLKRLNEGNISDLSGSILGSSAYHPQIVDWLYKETEGNVFFLIEIVRELAEKAGELDLINLDILPETFLTGGIKSLVQRRLGYVPETARPLLDLAALAGRDLDLKLLATFTTDLNQWLETCNLVGILDVEQDRWRFAHDKLREGILSEIPADAMAGLHLQLATKLEQVHPDDPAHVPAIAQHYQSAGIHDKAVMYLKQAGELAQSGFANAEAIEFFRAALSELALLAPGDADTWLKTRISLNEHLGDVLELTGQHEDARQPLNVALSLVPSGDLVHFSAIKRKIGRTYLNQRAYPKSLEVYDEVIGFLDNHPMESDSSWWFEWIDTQIERISINYWTNKPKEMREIVAIVKPHLEKHATISQQRLVVVYKAMIELRAGRFTISNLEELFADLPESDEWAYTVTDSFTRFGIGFLHLWHGDLDKAETYIRQSLKDSEQLGDVTTLSRAIAYLTVIFRKRGLVDDVREYADRLLQTASIGNMIEYIASAYGHQAWHANRSGNIEKAYALAEEGYRLIQGVPIGGVIVWITLWPLIAAEISKGQLEDAINHVRVLIGPTQQPQPETIVAQLQLARDAWAEGNNNLSEQHLLNASQIAREYGYT